MKSSSWDSGGVKAPCHVLLCLAIGLAEWLFVKTDNAWVWSRLIVGCGRGGWVYNRVKVWAFVGR